MQGSGMVRLGLAVFLSLTSVAGCASPPKSYSIQNSATVLEPYNVVWTRIIQWFTTNQVQIRTIDKSSGVIYAERASGAGSDFVDCGTPGITVPVARPISMNVFVQEIDPRKTSVTVNVTATETRTLDTSSFQVQCNSTGRLERQVLAAATRK